MNQSFLNKITSKLQAYVPGEQPTENDWVKLNTNEHAYPPSPKINEALEKLDLNQLRKYPSPIAAQLRDCISQTFSINPKMVMVCNGSDESLRLICQATLETGSGAGFPEVTYSLYEILVKAFGPAVIVPNLENLKVDVTALSQSIASVLFLPNPNAPTGEMIETKYLFDQIKKSDKLWIIDEAYNDFVDDENPSMIPYLDDLPNLVVTRSFSKGYALAGLRLGFLATGNNQLLEGLQAIKDSYNTNYVSQYLGLIGLQDQDYYKGIRNSVINNRTFLTDALRELHWDVLDSQGNFILASPGDAERTESIFSQLKEKKILVRYFKTNLLSRYLRITIGTNDEVRQLLSVLRET
jgi:histidinol-phosphate aminotransferase